MTGHANGAAGTYPGSYAPAPAPAPPSLPPEAPPPVGPARTAAAGRRTSHRALIISVLVVLLGGLLAFAAASVLTRHSRVLAVSRDVPVGATITSADLSVASVTSDPNLSPIPASAQSQVVGLVAQVGLVKGELLTRAQLGTGSGLGAGQVLVALPLKPGQFPIRNVSAGQQVLVVATPGANGTAPGAGTAAADGTSPVGPGGAAGGIEGTVADVGAMSQVTGVTVLDVRVSASAGVSLARVASTGNLAVILLPAAGR